MAKFWTPTESLSEAEFNVMKRVNKAPLFRFFREFRHELFDEATQQALLATHSPLDRGRPVVPPAQMELAMLLQAALGVSDQEVPELTACDRRWQMVLDCLGAEEPLMSQGSIFNFRMRCIEHNLVQVLIDRTVALARETKGYSAARLRVALDSSPLKGAGRVEDTLNLIARAACDVVRTAAERMEKPVEVVAKQAGIPLVTGSSVKAALDVDWTEPKARTEALQTLLDQVGALHR